MPVDTLATKLSKGRTALHYSCRNGFLEASKCLVTFGKLHHICVMKNGKFMTIVRTLTKTYFLPFILIRCKCEC